MKILLDARTVGREFSGVGTYVLELVRAFARLDEDVQVHLCVHGPSRLQDVSLDERFHFVEAAFSHESHPLGDAWEQFVLPRLGRELGVDVLHGPAFLIPTRRTSTPKVVTICDLVAYSHRETVPLRYGIYMRWLIRRAVRHASRVITISESVRRELLEKLPADPARVDCVLCGVSDRFHPPPERRRDEILERLGLRRPYLVFVGNLEPRKNLKGLLRAYRLVRHRRTDVPRLVIAGKIAWKSRTLLQELGADDLREFVHTTGYIEPEDLPALYAGSSAFLFPTFWEGFGLPVLEAMACGVPVVTSGISSIPEVAGDAAVLIDPYSDESIAAGILSVLDDPARREDLVQRGRERAATFTWERTAHATLDVYRRAVAAAP